MSSCLSKQFLRSRLNRLPVFLSLQTWSGISVQNISCMCARIRIPRSVYTSRLCPQSRLFSSTTVCYAEGRLAETFDHYYEAVIEAHKSNEDLIMYKYNALPENPAEREREIKKGMFIEAIDIYVQRTDSPHFTGIRRGHIEFIKQALNRMKELGIHREIDCYHALIKVFPPDLMVPTNVLQNEFYHYPKQQDAAFEILEQMEDNTIIPNEETRDLLTQRFGSKGHLVRKVRRMIYWFRKFQNINPYKLPYYLPVDAMELAILALKKMAVDLENQIKVFKVTENGESSFIASSQSPLQRELIRKHPESRPLYVEGGYRVWLRDTWQTYFILRDDSDPKLFQYPTKDEIEDNLDFDTIFEEEEPKQLAVKPNVHQQEDGTILGMCITETSSKDSLISWIRCLQETNPSLENIPVVFTLQSPEEFLVPVSDNANEKKEKSGVQS